ncbi:YadA-like family protein [Histophilus somni]|uniref:YadA-like family protein n=1 Tax=Histophilus somni TaxID=731 RepID=UPI00094AE10A|nr:YadA-like family protein [Histophilus somni]
MFLDNAQNFNYTEEYPAVDFRFLLDISGVGKNEYVNGKGELVGKDGNTPLVLNGEYFVRDDGKTWSSYYLIKNDNGEEVFYKNNGHSYDKVTERGEIEKIKKKDDYLRKQEYDSKVNVAYEKYLDKDGGNKIEKEKKLNGVKYDNRKTHTWARGKNAIAVGARSIAYGDYTTAIGTFAIAFKDYSTAIGSDTIAFGKESLVLGNKSYVYADRTVGVGTNVQAINDGAMVYGSDSYAGGRGSLAIGNYALANIEMDDNFNNDGLQNNNGFTLTDSKNSYGAKFDFEELYEKGNTADIQTYSRLIKPKTTKQEGTEELKAKQSRDSLGYNQGGIAIGSYSVALGDNTLTIGRYAYAKEDSAIAIGRFSFAKEKDAFAIGSFTRAIGQASIALGNNTYSGKQYSVAIGYKAQSQAEKGIALGIEAGVGKDATGALALGNEAEANLSNSVALGYKSTTNYFYDNKADASDKFTPKLSGEPASKLDAYKAAGSTYEIKNDASYGVISVGGWKVSEGTNTEAVGLRRIINVAPGALDSDVATVGQLKTLEYVKKEGLVVYYTVDNNNKIVKLMKASDDGEFYRVDTRNGEPLKKLGKIDKNKVFVGAKGFDEKTQTFADGKTTADIGETIKFGHLADGEISATSDQAITGAQLNSAKEALGLEYQKDSQTKFKKHDFTAVNYVEAGDKGSQDTFKAALTETIAAINSGYKFSDGTPDHPNKDTPFYLGSTIEIVNGDIESNSKTKYVGKNLETKFEQGKTNNSVAKFTIGLKDDPEFKSVTITEAPTNDNHAVNFLQLKNFATNVLGAEVDNGKFTFKKSQFNKFKNGTEQNGQILKEEKTFKAAIEANIDKINKGFIFGSGDGDTEKGTHYLGDKLIIKAGAVDKPTTTQEGGYVPDNIKTAYLKDSKQLLIGIKESPTFKNVLIENDIPEDEPANPKKNTYDNYAVNKKYLDKRLEKVAANFTVKGDNSKDNKEVYTLDKEHNELTIAGDSKNIDTKVDKNKQTVSITLKDALTGIKSVANGDDVKISLNNGTNGSGKSIVFTAGNSGKTVTLTEDKFSGVSEISSKDSKSKLTLNADKATVELAHDKSKLELKENEATITAGTDAGSLKITSNGKKQIELSPESGATLTFTKSDSDKVKISGVASGLGDSTANTNNIENVLTGTSIDTVQNNAINVKDLSDVAKAIIGKGLTFSGNSGTANVALGETITIKGDGTGVDIMATASATEKALTLTLNKETTFNPDSDKVVTSKAVAEELKKYTQRDTLVGDLEEYYLEIDGANVKDKAIFGSNIGIDKINLKEDETEGTSELVQAKALVDYLKGTGDKSVKLSDSAKTQAIGTGSISIGHNAVSQNEGSIALGYNSFAKNQGAISIGQDSDVLGLSSISVGKENKVEGHYSFVLGESNTIMKEQTYVIGSNNKIFGNRNISIGSYNNIEGNENILLGSHIQMDETIRDAIVLGNSSQGVEGALSVGSAIKRRKIVFVADPTNPYDAVNKRYLEARGIKFKGTENGEHLVKLDQLLTIDSSESKVSQNQANSGLTDSMEKDIKTKVEVNGDGTKLILTLNKTDSVSENDERAVTSKAVHTAINAVKQDLTNVEISYKANGTGEAKKVKLSDGFNFKDGTNTTAVVEDKGVVKFNLNKELKDMTSFETEAKDGNKAKLDQSGLTVGDKDATNDDKTHTVYGKDGLTVHGKDGKSAVSLKVKNENGKGTATLEFSKDDEKGTGAITGLKDLDEKSTGDMAANKNYVDTKFGEVDKKLEEKIASANSNRPFDYYAGEEKVVKGQDGQFYKPDEIKDAKFEGGKYKKDGQEVKITVKQDDVVIKAEPKTGPMKITNVKDGDLTDKSTDAVNGSQLVKATGAKFIDDSDSSAEPKAKKMVFADGKDGKSGLEADSMAMKGLTGKDGLNGKNANDKANALRNGEVGTVVFTDDKGERLVKANDGKYYKAEDVENNGTPKADKSAVNNPQLSLVNTGGETDKPVVLGNVASGLGIDADKAKEAADKTNNANKVMRDNAKDLSDKVSDMLKKGEELDTLRFSKEAQQDAVDALETALKYMPEETDAEKEAKSRVKDNLKREKQKLSELTDKFTGAEKRVKEAKEAVEKAKDTLKTSKSSYENALKESNREINALLSGDKKINVHRGANLQDLQALGQAGLNFEGNDGVPVHKNLGEKLTIKGEGEFNSVTTAAGNIKVDASETGLEVKLSDKLKNMTSFETKETAEGNKSRLDGNGLRVIHKDGKSAQYEVDGVRLTVGKHSATLTPSGLTLTNPQGQRIEIDGAKGEIRVPDLTPNSSPNAVVNKGYVDALQTHTDKKFNQLENRFDAFSKESRAGIAGSNAAAALPTISIPGKSVLSVSAGTYKGQSAVALGYSRVSDNGKVLLKLHGNSNSVGDFGGGVGIGWAW